jgi:hypothetical protein
VTDDEVARLIIIQDELFEHLDTVDLETDLDEDDPEDVEALFISLRDLSQEALDILAGRNEDGEDL